MLKKILKNVYFLIAYNPTILRYDFFISYCIVFLRRFSLTLLLHEDFCAKSDYFQKIVDDDLCTLVSKLCFYINENVWDYEKVVFPPFPGLYIFAFSSTNQLKTKNCLNEIEKLLTVQQYFTIIYESYTFHVRTCTFFLHH